MCTRKKPVTDDEVAAEFKVKLKAGPTRVKAWFGDDSGTTRSAYYVYLRRL
jgi:hypothetical protein